MQFVFLAVRKIDWCWFVVDCSFEVFSWRMATDPKVFTLEEVASHNSVTDCWLVMFGKVIKLI